MTLAILTPRNDHARPNLGKPWAPLRPGTQGPTIFSLRSDLLFKGITTTTTNPGPQNKGLELRLGPKELASRQCTKDQAEFPTGRKGEGGEEATWDDDSLSMKAEASGDRGNGHWKTTQTLI